MIRILGARYPMAKVLVVPVRVQGVEAPPEIVEAIRYANQMKLADLLIVGRGGGSIEDLWAFNDERVAYAIYESEIPVISAVGHEPDVTIADFVADLRAATPSNAAELAVPDQTALIQTLDSLNQAMAISLNRQLKTVRQKLDLLSSSPAFSAPNAYIEHRRKDLSYLQSRMIAVQNGINALGKERLAGFAAKLDAMSPLKVLARGYTITEDVDGMMIHSAQQITDGETITVRFIDGKVKATVTGKEPVQ